MTHRLGTTKRNKRQDTGLDHQPQNFSLTQLRLGQDRKRYSLVLAELELQRGDVFPEFILPADLEGAREVVHLLEVPDGLEALCLHVFSPGTDPVGCFCSRGQVP